MIRPLSLITLLFGPLMLTAQDNALPPTNRKVLDFVERHLNKRVGTGECWDLAAAALNSAGATWDGRYTFGRRIDPDQELVLPGDIVQFDRVEVYHRTANTEYRERMPQHTAVIQAVLGEGRYTLAHQNFGPRGKLVKKVGRSEFVAANVVKGTYIFYRPQP